MIVPNIILVPIRINSTNIIILVIMPINNILVIPMNITNGLVRLGAPNDRALEGLVEVARVTGTLHFQAGWRLNGCSKSEGIFRSWHLP